MDDKELKSDCARTFWNNVSKILKNKGKTYKWLAEETGLNRQSMSSAKYIGKFDLMLVTVLKITKALEVSPDVLFFGIDNDVMKVDLAKTYLIPISDKKNEDESVYSIIASYGEYLSPKQGRGLLNHALSYLDREIDDYEGEKNAK